MPENESEADGGISRVDEIFDALANRRRRFLLWYLQAHDVASVEELAAQVAAREVGRPPEAISPDRRERVTTDLVHTQLPKLQVARFVEYDHRSRTVRSTDLPPLLESLLELLVPVHENAPGH